MRSGTELQQLQTDVNTLLSEGCGMIHSSPVGVDTSDIELTVDSVSGLLTDINQQVFHTHADTHTQVLQQYKVSTCCCPHVLITTCLGRSGSV